MSEICKVAIVALGAAFVILLMNKTGLREKMRDALDLKGIKFIPDMLDCDFCISFWCAVVICFIASIFTLDFTWILVPVFSSPLTRYLI